MPAKIMLEIPEPHAPPYPGDITYLVQEDGGQYPRSERLDALQDAAEAWTDLGWDRSSIHAQCWVGEACEWTCAYRRSRGWSPWESA